MPTIFFSWQADTSTREGRSLIERALERAASRIGRDANVEEVVRELEVDRDTKGAPGSPPIVETIFRKIDKAAIFVPDLTFVANRLDGRPSPNPNVLVEYGWALKSLGHSRILPIMNSAFGKPTAETMPFDMIHLRHPILYDCPVSASEDRRRQERESLADEVEQRIREILTSDEFKASLPEPTKPPPFQRQDPKEGAGKFRSHGEPLGITADSWGRAAQEIRLLDGPAMWLRLMPEFDPGREWLVSELNTAVTQDRLMPLCHGAGGYGHIRAHDGFGVYKTTDPSNNTRDVVFLFKTGEIWTIDTDYLQATAHENGIVLFENEFRDALKTYSRLLTRLGVAPPFTWIAGM